ncbi:hypothetical protein A2303_05030 [Candidatus Falkowbacteria bacterium RIFOXYB2_FULL_47_14]|uniref:Uncharacterized protein n=1 Tax=Candidatus Falkowbacteria bacterium RIFOXYA2_FULL_47_19 TaxID=1797994 RepID=A0A1F5SHJ6_9BACT|nr:MAG: hypothetical protein A2227_02860 [Candidatus Falkowbacteria bacterium RIFOXYA2_FULL_47_19]OGF34348.1 MAG: hypothetical protein A2468_04365 [Candidatus Falkowbacteria bacterium RIFOXYC2_FULL_46_15]OGF42737.1 MAG: hypothetical protein A2303_05030 [Candidatus Falkowbacteria bacterium RIFOXYB2_FULL_47_14]
MIPELQPSDDYTNNYRLELLKAIKSLLSNERELKRLLASARDNLKGIYGWEVMSNQSGDKLELEILRLSTNKKYTKDMLDNTDALLGHKFRNTVHKFEDEYIRKIKSIEACKKMAEEIKS